MRFVTENIGWKLLSLAIAVLLWISVSSEPELASFVSVPVQYKDIPEDLEIASDVVESVTLELRGPSGELRDFAENNRAAAVLDMRDARAGERTYTITEGNVRLPRGLRLVRAVPAQIRFDFETRVPRTVPVRARFTGAQPGYEVAQVLITPRTLTITGPQTRVERVQAAVTDPIDLSAVVGTAQFHVNAFVGDGRVQISGSPQVAVRVTMKRK